MNEVEARIERVARKFKETFGIDVVEPTANGCWFEKQHHANGNRLRTTKLMFLTKGDLLELSAVIEELKAEFEGAQI